MKRLIIITLLCLLLVPLCGLSKRRAVLLSAIMPGLGQAYTGSYQRAGVFLGAELAIMITYFDLNNAEDDAYRNMQIYAEVHAGIDRGQSAKMYLDMQRYYSSDDYNARFTGYSYGYNPDDYINLYSGDKVWRWDSKESHSRYYTLRQNKQKLQAHAKLAFGAAVLNRLVSIIDAMYLVSSQNKNSGHLTFVPNYKDKGMNVNYEIKF